MRPIVLIILIAGWQTTAQAFFCFNFGGHGRHDNRLAAWAWQPPPPPSQLYAAYPAVEQPQPLSDAGRELPPIRETKKSPEIIQGYRFRPMLHHPVEPAVSTPRDWRD